MDWGRFAQQMASMARDLLAQESVNATLQRITASATELVDGCDAAGLLVLHGKKVEAFAPTDQRSSTATSCRSGWGRGRASMPPGPRRENDTTGRTTRPLTGERVFRITDLTQEPRWPACDTRPGSWAWALLERGDRVRTYRIEPALLEGLKRAFDLADASLTCCDRSQPRQRRREVLSSHSRTPVGSESDPPTRPLRQHHRPLRAAGHSTARSARRPVPRTPVPASGSVWEERVRVATGGRES